MLRAATYPAAVGQVYNMGGEPIQLVDLAKLLIECHGAGSFRIVPFPPERKAIDIGDYYGSYAKIKAGLDWEPRIVARDGLQRSIDYYRLHLAHYI
jgi:UDP-glucose 4-epimerase